jgi:hypothetical protein
VATLLELFGSIDGPRFLDVGKEGGLREGGPLAQPGLIVDAEFSPEESCGGKAMPD